MLGYGTAALLLLASVTSGAPAASVSLAPTPTTVPSAGTAATATRTRAPAAASPTPKVANAATLTAKVPPPARGKAAPLNPCQKSIALQATNLFENDQTTFAYGYCENIKDGRGYTAGIAGFCTGTHDAYRVIKRYMSAAGSGKEFTPYLATLHRLDKNPGTSGSVQGLNGYCPAWARAARNPVFRTSQLSMLQDGYYGPSQSLADQLGLSLPLARAQLYDAAIQHGVDLSGNGGSSVNGLARRATVKAGGSPAGGKVTDAQWLTAFLSVRQGLGGAAAKRVASYRYALKASGGGAFDQKLVLLNVDGKPTTVTCNLKLAA